MLSFSSAPGNLMNRLGKAGLLVKNAKAFQATLLSSMTDTTNGVVAQFNAESDIQAIMGGAYIGSLSGLEGICQTATAIAIATVNRMVFRDFPLLNQTLQSTNTLASLVEIIVQMKQQGATVLAMTIGATPSTFTGVGNGVINYSTRRPYDCLVLENSLAETLLFTCISDSYTGGATLGNEGFVATGAGSQGDVFAFNWPLGSNATQSLNAIDGDSDETSGNLLNNSGFANWTSNIPDQFRLLYGVAGTDIIKETTLVYTYSGSASVKLVGDGITQTSLWQQFNISTGTTQSLSPVTQYSFCVFMRRDGTAAGQGILTIDLIDSISNPVYDSSGIANSFTIDLTQLTTTYTAYKGVFRTPLVFSTRLPLAIRLTLTTPLTTGRAVYLDKMSLGIMTQLYPSGPYAAIHSGSVPFNFADYGTLVVTNSRGAGGTLSTWQTLFEQFFTMSANGLLLPSSNAPSVSDLLIG